MKTFVKIKGHPNWFWLVQNLSELPHNIGETMQKRLIESVSGDLFKTEDGRDNSLLAKLNAVAHNPPNYARIIHKYGSILIRPVGSFMLFDGEEVIETILSENAFPKENSNSHICICENTMIADAEWVEYLKNRFNKPLEVLNFFSTRPVDEIAESLAGMKFITFSTTFTNMEWFENLCMAIPSNFTGKIIGYCHDAQRWEVAKEILSKHNLLNRLEIVTSFNEG